MSLPSYQITVMDHHDGGVLAVFSGEQITMTYSRALNDVGALSLAMPLIPDYDSIFSLDNFIEVKRTDPVSGALVVEETYLSRHVRKYRDQDDEMFVVGGLSLNNLIARRVIDPADDPLQASGFSTKAGDAMEVMRSYAREQMGDLASVDRQTVNLSIPVGVSNGKNVGDRIRFDNLFDKLQDFAQRSEVDFQIRRSYQNFMVMDIKPLGVDRSKTANAPNLPYVYFSVKRANLNAPSLEVDRRDEKNFVYVEGQGQGTNRYLFKVGTGDQHDSAFNRIEFHVDAANAQNNDPYTILGAGLDALFANRKKVTFTHTPTNEEPGAIYRADWDLGDMVTVGWLDYEADLRIVNVEITLSEDNEDLKIRVEQR